MANWSEMAGHWAEKARILVVDDNTENTFLICELLAHSGYRETRAETDSTTAVSTILGWRPDLVVLDLHMPKVSGFDILTSLQKQLPPDAFMPILVFSADWTEATKKRALDLGASDFVTKPFDATEFLLRVRNFLRMRQMHVMLEEQNRGLESLVERRTRHLMRARTEAMECLARAGEFRDDMTGEHARRVAALSGRIAKALGLNRSTVDLIETAAPLHDLGKIGISDAVLLKPGRLTPMEYEEMKLHAGVGGTIIGKAKSPLLRKAREIALFHHENWDGSGYPHGVKGNEIPISARIVAVADTFDALVHERPYKQPWPRHDAIAEIQRLRGNKFDPAVVDAFLCVCDQQVVVAVVEEEHLEPAASL